MRTQQITQSHIGRRWFLFVFYLTRARTWSLGQRSVRDPHCKTVQAAVRDTYRKLWLFVSKRDFKNH